MADSIGFIGLGNMGEAMARNLIEAGFELRAYNRTASKAQALAHAHAVATPAEAAREGGIVITMVANDAALEEVVHGAGGFAAALGRDGLHISMSTVSSAIARRLAQVHAQHGSHYLAAPVFGRPEAAAARKLWICQSGSDEAKRRARPVLEHLGQGIHDFGSDPGAANVVKLCGNFLILAAIEAMAEALALAEKSGLERAAVSSFFGQSIFACPIYQNYGRILAARQYQPAGFKLALGMKDVRLVRESAEAAQVPMPIGSLLHERMLASLAKGREDLDWTAIELLAAEAAGLR